MHELTTGVRRSICLDFVILMILSFYFTYHGLRCTSIWLDLKISYETKARISYQRFYLREIFTLHYLIRSNKPRGIVLHRFLIGRVYHVALFINNTIAHVASRIDKWPGFLNRVSVYLCSIPTLDPENRWWIGLHSLDFHKSERSARRGKVIFMISCLSRRDDNSV